MFDKKVAISLIVFFISILTQNFVFGIKPKGWILIIQYLVIYIIVSLFFKKDIEKVQEEAKYKDWPTSGPIGRFGQNGLKLMFFSSGLLTFLNPFQLVQIVCQAFGNMKLKSQKDLIINDASAFKTKINYTLPFEKNQEWLVYNGGSREINSHSWGVITQRYAYDFVIADEKHNRHSNKGTNVKDYFCYNQNIVAVADGIVVKTVNNKRDAPFVGYGILDFLTTSFIGNYVIIRHTENEHSFYAHLVKGSVVVKKGDTVKQGQIIGKCGHSGYSSEPHLHFHLQDKIDFYTARGLPIRFSNLKIDNQFQDKPSFIEAGNKIQNI